MDDCCISRDANQRLNVSELVVILIVWECLWKCVLWFRNHVLKNVNHLAVTEKHRHKPQAEEVLSQSIKQDYKISDTNI